MESLLLKIFVTAAIGLGVFILRASHSYIQHRRRVKASIQLVIQYAKKAHDNISILLNTYEYCQTQIKKGDPYGEPEKNYTPVLLITKEYELSFDQVSEILRYLNTKQQELLLNYFSIQSNLDAMIDSVNSDYFRAMKQERKAVAFEILINTTKSMKPAVSDLIQSLEITYFKRASNKIRAYMQSK